MRKKKNEKGADEINQLQCLVPRTEAKHKIKTKVKVEIKTEIKPRKKKKLKQLNKKEKMKLILMKQLKNQEKYRVAIDDQNES